MFCSTLLHRWKKRVEVRPAYLDLIVVGALFACAALLAFSRIQDFDFFWHLANGKEMWLERRVINREVFSYTRPGVPFSNHGWLAEVILYALFVTAGPLGIVVFKTCLVTLLAWLAYRTARLTGASSTAAAVLMVLAILGGLERYRERPELFSLLLFTLTGYLLHGASTGKLKRTWLYALPAIFTVWDLLHGAIYGFVYLAAFLFAEAMRALLHAERDASTEHPPLLKDLVVVSALAGAASLVNPYGIRKYDFFAAYLLANPMVARIAEWGWSPFGLYPVFWVMLLLFVLLAFLFGRGTAFPRTFVALPFMVLAIRYRRAIPFFTLAALPAAAGYLVSAARRSDPRVARGFGAAVAAALVGATVFLKFIAGDNPYTFGYEVNGLLLPVGSTRYLARSPLQGNMYNPGHFGGYLAYYLYPERRIFLYNHHVTFRDLPSVLERPELLDRYDIQYAVLERRWGDSAGYGAVFSPEKWALVFWDDASMIVVRRSPQHAAFLQSNALRLFSPDVLSALERYSSDPGSLERYEADPVIATVLAHEIASCMRFYESKLLADYVGYLFLRHQANTAPGAALADIEAALEENPSSAYLWFALSCFERRLGHEELARQALGRASTLDSRLVDRLAKSPM
jgi:hypothetical protein